MFATLTERILGFMVLLLTLIVLGLAGLLHLKEIRLKALENANNGLQAQILVQNAQVDQLGKKNAALTILASQQAQIAESLRASSDKKATTIIKTVIANTPQAECQDLENIVHTARKSD